MSRRQLEWGRALCIWLVSWGLYIWLGGPSLQFIWWLCSAMLVNGLLIQALGPSHLTVQRDISPSYLYAGEDTEIMVTIRFKSFMPLPWIMMTEEIGGVQIRKLWFPGFRRSVSYSYSIENLTRGSWTSADTTLEWGDLFGWFRASRKVVSPAELTVLPRPLSIRGMQDIPFGSDEEILSVYRPFLSGLPGSEIREYVPGDPLNRIHWKNSARLGRLQTFLPQPGRSANRSIILVTSQDGYPDFGASKSDTSFEDAIKASAGLIYASSLTFGTSSLWIGGAGRAPVRMDRTQEMDFDMLLPLASVPSMPCSGSAAEILESAAADEDLETELLVVTGSVNVDLMKSALQILSMGRKIIIYCTDPLPEPYTGSHSLSPEEGEQTAETYAEQLMQTGNFCEVLELKDQYLRAGGRLVHISGGDVYEIRTLQGEGDEDREYQQLIQ
ncbi:DUF58 domain-containing protein [Paenibacillus faecalis]|uniref:DUF58 domain-containing protein n=1 Tax=Paenibacillus faecalis TaxID=2079532 RepID=UPI000D0FBD2F|nr:DUF58 domain-containing protein [Paenibacillus faecalis]